MVASGPILYAVVVKVSPIRTTLIQKSLPLAPPPRHVLRKFVVLPTETHAKFARDALLLDGQLPVRLSFRFWIDFRRA